MTRARLAVLAVLVTALAIAVATTRTSSARSDTPTAHQITVQGLGTVEAIPDTVAFSFGVQTSAKTASAALAANGEAAQKVIAALKQAGIAAKDIQTQQVSLSQRLSEDGQTVLGYNASSSVSATLPSIAKAGAVIDAAVNAGADSVEGPSLTLSNERALERKALAAAVADAKARGEALAAAAGVTLGQIVAITEGGVSAPVPLMQKANATADSTVPIEPGTQQVQDSVTVTFATA
jgi:uncharacterized protein YggE